MICMEWHFRNDMFGMTCLEWHVWNDMFGMTSSKWYAQNNTFGMTCSDWHVWNDTFLFLASIFFYFQNLHHVLLLALALHCAHSGSIVLPSGLMHPPSNNSTYLLIVCQQDDMYIRQCIETDVSKRMYFFFAPTLVQDILKMGDHPIIQISFSDCLRMSTTTQCIIVEEFKS